MSKSLNLSINVMMFMTLGNVYVRLKERRMKTDFLRRNHLLGVEAFETFVCSRNQVCALICFVLRRRRFEIIRLVFV